MAMADGRIPNASGHRQLDLCRIGPRPGSGGTWAPQLGRANHLPADRANHVARRVALIGHQIRGVLRRSIIGSRRIRWRHDPETLVEPRVVPPATQHSGECRVAL
jgi:hypothetical protein